MKETISVRNVGALKDTGLMEIQPLTILIGDSASGKSTLMKLIVLMRYIFKRVVIRSYIKNSNVNNTVFYIRFDDLLRDDIKQVVNKDSFIEYIAHINGHNYSIKYENGRLQTPSSIPNEDLVFMKEVWVSEMRSAIAPLAAKGSWAKNASLGFYFDETFSEFDEATELVKQFGLNYIGLKMNVIKGGNNQKKYELNPIDGSYGKFELRHASSGIQTTVPLMVLVQYYADVFSFKAAQKRNIIDLLYEKDLTTQYHPDMELADVPNVVHLHIEEPELSLDPTSQIRFFNELVKIAFEQKSDNRQIGLVMATHSPYIVNDLNLLIKAHDCQKTIDGAHLDYDNIAVYQLEEGRCQNLKMNNLHFINVERLSEDINVIYDQYDQLKQL
ncbi:MAG: ATP-binding protein [Paludibacter sp.]|nr:ATP-binding protein [Bacteroidales bacterium]MCM1069086.1 ATP-binding protein [Prevotella sp.]MCM1353525.1 ATP-binding protein [Bacteroides sp.]MCM1442686.1 ATP-binding protein [Muribaculum sp.]MCM1481678.1 ATP-binding protein [Paludibacter sp.]